MTAVKLSKCRDRRVSRASFLVVLLESLDEGVGIVGRVVVDNIGRVLRVDFVNVFSELAAWLALDLLDLLESTALDEGALGLKVGRKDFSELSANIGENVVRSKLKEGLKGGKVSAHLDDVLKSLLCLVLKILGALGKHVDGEESGGNISLSKEFGMIGRVSSNLAERPGSSSLKVVLRLVNKGILKRSNTLRNNNCHSE